MKENAMVDGMIFHGPGGCPKCGTPLWVADSEITLLELNSNGVPISEETTTRVKGVCPNCGEKVPMMRWGGNYRPAYDGSFLTFLKCEIEADSRDRIKKQNMEAKEKNPFDINA